MKEINGMRIYGSWAGSPNGTPEDTTKCIEEVWESGRGMFHHQCNRKRGYGKDGLYCKIHNPEYIAKKNAERDAKYEKELSQNRIAHSGKLFYTTCKELVEKDNFGSIRLPALARRMLEEAINEVEGKS